MILFTKLSDSWFYYWLASWVTSPLGEARHIRLHHVSEGINVRLELNGKRGVAVYFENDEEMLKLVHRDCNEEI